MSASNISHQQLLFKDAITYDKAVKGGIISFNESENYTYRPINTADFM